MPRRDAVLVTWLAFNNDPYERGWDKGHRLREDGSPIRGPTLTLLFDEMSEFNGRVGQVVMFVRDDPESVSRAAATKREVHSNDKAIDFEIARWDGDDPTDHAGIFAFLKDELPRLRRRFAGRKLVIHISPGTPSMATIWVLMAEAGFIDEPFTVVKSYRASERCGRPAVVSVRVGLDTFYKRYKKARPQRTAGRDENIHWDRALFRSEALTRLYDDAERLARLKAPVMLLGERGTGKTTLAGWIRFKSPFRKASLDKGWPSVACGQYQPETMRAELFGYKKGAFTGADRDHEGLLAKADGDTLFLDEVGDLTKDTQRLLIRAIEDKRFQPLGSTEWKTSDFRLITATNVPLPELRDRLDPDFFDRIAPLRLRIPPLRETAAELEWLWPDVWSRVCEEVGASLPLDDAHHAEAMKFLKAQALPGNVRDVRATAIRLLANFVEVPTAIEVRQWLSTSKNMDEVDITVDLPRAVARRFGESEFLDGLVSEHEPLNTKAFFKVLQSWIAEEVRRIARVQGLQQDALVDVTPKTLREWMKDG